MLFLRGRGCDRYPFAETPDSPVSAHERRMIHELLHALGFVAPNAPHHVKAHVPDSNDVMAAGGWSGRQLILDVGQDDYFGSNVPAGVLNLVASPFLLPA